MKKKKNKDLIAIILSLLVLTASSVLEYMLQTHNGSVRISTTRIATSDGSTIEAKLYVPENADAQNLVPLIITSPGGNSTYQMIEPINEELTARGYAVLTYSMFNHGSSDISTDPNYGAEAVIEYGAGLPFVDTGRIGLIGQARSSAYLMRTSINHDLPVSAIFSIDFSADMNILQGYDSTTPISLGWAINKKNEYLRDPQAVFSDAELKSVFGIASEASIEPGRTYGSAASGTLRVLFPSSSTDSFYAVSRDVVLAASDFFHQTLGGSDLSTTHIGWMVFLQGCGFYSAIALMLCSAMAALRGQAHPAQLKISTVSWQSVLVILIPAVSFIPLYTVGSQILVSTPLFPQCTTNGHMIWMVVMILFCLIMLWKQKDISSLFAISTPMLAAGLTGFAVGYFALLIRSSLFSQTFSFLCSNLSVFSLRRFTAALAYLPIFLIYSVLTELCRISFFRFNTGTSRQYLSSILCYTIPYLAIFLINLSGFVFAGHALFHWGRFAIAPTTFLLPILPASGIISESSYRRTGSVWLGSLLNALLLTWQLCSSNSFYYM